MKILLFVLRLIQWFVYLPIHVILVLSAPLYVGWVVRNFTTDNLLDLKWPFKLLMTGDNPMTGDKGWQEEHMPIKGDPYLLENRIGWVRRNKWNRFNFQIIGAKADLKWIKEFVAIENDKWFFIRPDGAWMLRCFIPIPFIKKYLNLYFGWSLFGAVNGNNKFTATIRIKSKKP